ncbi:MAG: cation/H(+) antiporter [Acidobacteria bacterium]|nr:cation/H(+) antiporter [Acidobacteriota bacterium]
MSFASLHPLSQLLLQLVTVLVAARVTGLLFARLGQSAVIGEIAAGVLLGPSLLGWIAPGVFQTLFPASSVGTLQLLSQIGVCLFLFVVGMTVDVGHLRQKTPAALVISHASIVVPALCGALLSPWLFPSLAGPDATPASFTVFMAISMSITAFPVLARILDERGLSATALGVMALTCAAVGDVTAWIMLAGIVAVTQEGAWAGSIVTLVRVAVFAIVMLVGVRRLLPRWMGSGSSPEAPLGQNVLVAALALMLVSALTTELIGIHALFGAFLAGVVMPRQGTLRQQMVVRIEDFSAVFLLPLFFVVTGLRTSITLINDLQGWAICAAIILVATAGKIGGTYVAARWTGMPRPDAFALGVLMNTRGLMELIALNIGYDLGILSPRIFAMLVIMALVTTALTGPLLTWAKRWR